MVTPIGLNSWGNPVGDAPYWRYQQRDDSCAVVAQASVYQSITGQYVSEADAVNIATAQGWFTAQNGTQPKDSGKLLNHLGVPIYRTYGANLDDLKTALANGEKLIASIDANEIWYPIRSQSGMPIEQVDGGHAVWVTGIEQELDGSYKVFLNDSGTPDGQQFVVDYEDFENAWQDSDFRLVVGETTLNNGALVGSQGGDEMWGNSNANWFSSSGGNDTLLGGMANDTLIGGSGVDKLEGGDGNDLLIGGELVTSNTRLAKIMDNDVDVMTGGAGRDTFALVRGRGIDLITDFRRGVDGLGLTHGLKYNQLDFSQNGKDTVISIGGDTIAVLEGVRSTTISKANFNTVLG